MVTVEVVVAAVLAQAGVALTVAVAASAAAAVAVVPDETVAEMIDDVCSLYPCTGTGATALI